MFDERVISGVHIVVIFAGVAGFVSVFVVGVVFIVGIVSGFKNGEWVVVGWVVFVVWWWGVSR